MRQTLHKNKAVNNGGLMETANGQWRWRNDKCIVTFSSVLTCTIRAPCLCHKSTRHENTNYLRGVPVDF